MRKVALPLVLAAMLLSAACGGGMTTTLPLTPSPTIGAPARAHTWVQYCDDDTGSYPRQYFGQANQLVAQSILDAIAPNSQGLTLYATAITSNTFDPANTLDPPFRVDATGTPPPLPPLTPTPTPGDPDPYHAGSVKGTINAANAKVIGTYNSAMQTYTGNLQAIKQHAASDVTRLTKWSPAVDPTATSIWGCLVLATQRIQGQAGPKYLVIASDLENNTNVDLTQVNLAGVVVHIIFFVSQDAVDAQNKIAYWKGIFVQAGASGSDISFDDPGVSTGLLSSAQSGGASLFVGA